MNTIDEIIKDVMTPYRRYLILFENDEIEPITLVIDENVNRPNNPDYDDLIWEYVSNNYGYQGFTSVRLDELKGYRIK